MLHRPSIEVVFTREAVRALDKAAIEEYGIPGIVLMENAAAALEEECLRLLRGKERSLAFICCGPGNNGGDGLALARRLHNKGARPVIVFAGDPASCRGDALTNLTIVRRMHLTLQVVGTAGADELLASLLRAHGKPALLVDALLGTGATRAPAPPISTVVEWMNVQRAEGVPLLAVDIPTGLDCDTGAPLGDHAVRADVTVTLAGNKKGLLAPGAEAYAGRIVVGDIGVPVELLERFGVRC